MYLWRRRRIADALSAGSSSDAPRNEIMDMVRCATDMMRDLRLLAAAPEKELLRCGKPVTEPERGGPLIEPARGGMPVMELEREGARVGVFGGMSGIGGALRSGSVICALKTERRFVTLRSSEASISSQIEERREWPPMLV